MSYRLRFPSPLSLSPSPPFPYAGQLLLRERTHTKSSEQASHSPRLAKTVQQDTRIAFVNNYYTSLQACFLFHISLKRDEQKSWSTSSWARLSQSLSESDVCKEKLMQSVPQPFHRQHLSFCIAKCHGASKFWLTPTLAYFFRQHQQ